MENKAEKIVILILDNLKGRRGVGQELESIDEDIYDEMVDDLITEVDGVLQQ